MRTLREQADAALAKDPDAKRFVSDTCCPDCQTSIRFTINACCCYCNKYGKPNKKTEAERKAAIAKKAFQKRLDKAVAAYENGASMEVAIKEGKCSYHSLRAELKRLGITIGKKSGRKLGSKVEPVERLPRQEEYDEAKVPLMAAKLMDDFYRSTHAKC